MNVLRNKIDDFGGRRYFAAQRISCLMLPFFLIIKEFVLEGMFCHSGVNSTSRNPGSKRLSRFSEALVPPVPPH